MAPLDALHMLTFAFSGAFLGTSIPFLVYVALADGYRHTEMIVAASFVVAYALLAVLYSFRALFVPALSPKSALRNLTNFVLLAILAVGGLASMLCLQSMSDGFSWLRHGYGRHGIGSRDMYNRLEMVFNGTDPDGDNGGWGGPPRGDKYWRQYKVSVIVSEGVDDASRRRFVGTMGMHLALTTLVLGWILVALLSAELVCAIFNGQRKFWIERTTAGIELRWRDGAIALPEGDEPVPGPRAQGPQGPAHAARAALAADAGDESEDSPA